MAGSDPDRQPATGLQAKARLFPAEGEGQQAYPFPAPFHLHQQCGPGLGQEPPDTAVGNPVDQTIPLSNLTSPLEDQEFRPQTDPDIIAGCGNRA